MHTICRQSPKARCPSASSRRPQARALLRGHWQPPGEPPSPPVPPEVPAEPDEPPATPPPPERPPRPDEVPPSTPPETPDAAGGLHRAAHCGR